MNDANTGLIPAIGGALGTGLPTLLLHFVTTLILLAAGVLLQTILTPFNERELLSQGNRAAGTVLAGETVAMAIPLAAILATSGTVIDIIVWGIVAVLLQLLTMGVVSLLLRGLKGPIEAGNTAAASVLAAAQVAVGLLNAAAMVPN